MLQREDRRKGCQKEENQDGGREIKSMPDGKMFIFLVSPLSACLIGDAL